MWDELKTPVVPVVFYGAFDLYPKGYHNLAICIYLLFLYVDAI